MDCTHAEMLLVEHVTGGSPEATSVDLEAHLSGCEACRALRDSLALGAKYAAVLPIEEPPKLDMTALRAAMRDRRGAADPDGPRMAAAAAPAPEPTGGHNVRAASADANVRPGYGELFRKWVTGPQVAMATLTCLVVAIGLTYVPLSQKGMPADGDTVAAPEAEPTASAPHVVVAEAAEAGRARLGQAPQAAPGQATAEPRVASADLRARTSGDVIDGLGILDTPSEATNAVPAPPVAAIVPPPPVPATRAAEAELAVPADRWAASSGYGAQAQRAQSEAFADDESAPAAPAASAPPATAAPTTATMASATRGVDPTAVLAQARSLRSSGACGAATNVYQRFLNESGASHPQRGPAMLELADCLQRTGRTGVARQTLEQAQGVPSVSAQARRELEESSEERRAPARTARPAAAPRQSDAVMDSAYRNE